jgi:hypothetical protein
VHVAVAIVSAAVIALMLAEFFITFLLPRRVKRDPRIARGVLRTLWLPWRAIASRLSTGSGDTMLGVFGPLGLLTILVVLSAGMILGFAGLQWADSSHLGALRGADVGDSLYFSASAFFSGSTSSNPINGLGKLLQVIEAAAGLSFLGIAIGYLPALFQAFSRRETAVTRLDPRAGSPPTAAALLERSSQRGGWAELNAYMHEWENWTADLMETHLSYPILGYFRSQHLRQNWLAALTVVVDACAYAIAYGPKREIDNAELTFRIGRHALADLALIFSTRELERQPEVDAGRRLSPEGLRELRSGLENSGLHSEGTAESEHRLERLRASYEGYAIAISRQLQLALPDWLPPDDVKEYWRAEPSGRLHDDLLS